MTKFLGDENIYDNPKSAFGVVIPMPFEFSTSYGKGTEYGPQSIIEASHYVELYDELLEIEPYRHGIFTTPKISFQNNIEENLNRIKKNVSKHLKQDKFIVVLGGEHSISQSVVVPYIERYKNLSVLQLDAHCDLRNSYEGSIYSHACVMRRIWDVNKNIVQCGIRSLSNEEAEFIKTEKIKTFFAHNLRNKNNWIEILDHLNEDVFITIDVDFFDPSVMPATGTPEPGGFFWDETVSFLMKLFEAKNVVGCDIVEFSPMRGVHYPEFLIAKLVYKIFGLKIKNNK